MNKIIELFGELFSYNKLALILVLVEMTKAVGFMSTLPDYLIYVFLLIFALNNYRYKHRLEPLFVLILAYIPIELILSQPDPLFRSWARYIGFVLAFLAFSPLIQGQRARIMRKEALMCLSIISTVLSAISFFCYFLGINFMRAGMDVLVYSAGVFGGLFRQSMLLGPIAGFASIYTSYLAYSKKERVFWVLSIMCIGAVLFSASRSALMATFAGNVVLLYKASRGNGKFLKSIMIITLLASITFPLWESVTDLVIEKQANNTASGDIFMSREQKWMNRINEIKSSPLFGVGFAAVDTNSVGDYSAHNGQIEPGTSWLSILSMLGLFGALIIMPIFITCYKYCNKMLNEIDALYMGFLVFFAVHLNAEGYIFSSGGFLFFMLWLTVGVAFDQKYEIKNS